jgi:hypothetical protein
MQDLWSGLLKSLKKLTNLRRYHLDP